MQLPIFIPSILENFFNGYFLASAPYMTDINSAKGSLASNAINLIFFLWILSGHLTDFSFMQLWLIHCHRWRFIGLRFYILVEHKRTICMNFECFTVWWLFWLLFGIHFQVFTLLMLRFYLHLMRNCCGYFVLSEMWNLLICLCLKTAGWFLARLCQFNFWIVFTWGKSLLIVHLGYYY